MAGRANSGAGGDDDELGKKKRKLTERERRMVQLFEATRKRRGISRAEVARRIGAKPPTVSNILNLKEGVGADRALQFIDALGLAIKETSESDPISVGSVGAGAVLTLDVQTLTLPCAAQVRVAFGAYLPGDVIYLRASKTFERGRWLLIERGGIRVFVQAIEREATRVFVTGDGDSLFYEPARHKIIARIYAYLRAE